jgi:23S rRNA (pseudouridine1915-N3)-methyltransferase
MSREILLLWAGRHRRNEWDRLCEPYRKRLARSVKIDETPVKVRGSGGGRKRLSIEAEALLAAVPESAYLVALDRRGQARSSRQLATWLEQLLAEWPHPIVFALGSDLGLDRSLVERARETLSLGPLTLPHELARLILYEQLYRAFCIMAGIKYHREPL